MEIKKHVEKALQEQKEMLNNGDFDHYKTEYGKGQEHVHEVVDCVDIDSQDFNIGYEQGYMYALQNVLAEINK